MSISYSLKIREDTFAVLCNYALLNILFVHLKSCFLFCIRGVLITFRSFANDSLFAPFCKFLILRIFSHILYWSAFSSRKFSLLACKTFQIYSSLWWILGSHSREIMALWIATPCILYCVLYFIILYCDMTSESGYSGTRADVPF